MKQFIKIPKFTLKRDTNKLSNSVGFFPFPGKVDRKERRRISSFLSYRMFVSSGNQIPQRGVGTKKIYILRRETRILNWHIDEMREGGVKNFASGVVGVNRV